MIALLAGIAGLRPCAPAPAARMALWIAAFLLASSAEATTVILDPTARGAYRSDTGAMWTSGSGTPTGNYLTGLLSAELESRGFVVFDLTGVTSDIQSAFFSVQIADVPLAIGVGAPAVSETLALFDVSSSLAALAGGSGGLAAFADLGTGTVLGQLEFDTGMQGAIIDIPLNAAALAALDAASGLIAFGTAVTSISGTAPQWIFGSSEGYPSRLRLETVPEAPAGALLLLAGLVWRAGAARVGRQSSQRGRAGLGIRPRNERHVSKTLSL